MHCNRNPPKFIYKNCFVSSQCFLKCCRCEVAWFLTSDSLSETLYLQYLFYLPVHTEIPTSRKAQESLDNTVLTRHLQTDIQAHSALLLLCMTAQLGEMLWALLIHVRLKYKTK